MTPVTIDLDRLREAVEVAATCTCGHPRCRHVQGMCVSLWFNLNRCRCLCYTPQEATGANLAASQPNPGQPEGHDPERTAEARTAAMRAHPAKRGTRDSAMPRRGAGPENTVIMSADWPRWRVFKRGEHRWIAWPPTAAAGHTKPATRPTHAAAIAYKPERHNHEH